MRMLHWLVLLTFTVVSIQTTAQSTVPTHAVRRAKVLTLYPGGAPGALGGEAADRPTVDVYLPSANPTHTAVLVIPGGGYGVVVADREGAAPAQWLAERGVAAFVLHYRVAPYRYPAPIQDAERAMRLLRGQAATFGFAPDHLGAWGFSAGGHLASVLATLFDNGILASPDLIERQSDRPDFVVLAYPVITMKAGLGNAPTLANLLGPRPDAATIALLSSEDQVTPMSPPAFVFATNDDDVVPAGNSVVFASACQRAGVPVELHLFEHGPHGVDLAENRPALRVWTALLESWMVQNQWMEAPAP